jgi:hypothetical protein
MFDFFGDICIKLDRSTDKYNMTIATTVVRRHGVTAIATIEIASAKKMLQESV